MFQKLVSNMAFSPGLVTQVGFYVKRLRQEEFIRRLGLIFTAMSIGIQTLTFINPPVQAQANHANNVVYEAITSKTHLLTVWDKGDSVGHKDIDDLFLFYGITKADVEKTAVTKLSSTTTFDGFETWTMGRKAYGKTGEYLQQIKTNENTTSSFYVRPWARSWGNYTTDVLKGKTASGRDFAVIMNCGNIVIAIEQEPALPYQGYFRTICENVGGWAYDPRRETAIVRVRIDVDGGQVAVMNADAVNFSGAKYYKDGIAGDHGFFWTIPDKYKDGKDHKVAVTMLESDTEKAARGGIAGSAEGSMVISSTSNVIGAECKLPDPEPEVSITVCDTRTWVIVKILETDRQDYHSDQTATTCVAPPKNQSYCDTTTGQVVTLTEGQTATRYVDPSQCQNITVCINDNLVSVKLYEKGSKPTVCPTVEVCRAGAVIPVTSDKVVASDLEPKQCDEVTVCDETTGLEVVLRGDVENSDFEPYIDSYGELTCTEPMAEFGQSKTASNLTKKIEDANNTKAAAGDEIRYELTTVNTGDLDGNFDIQEDLLDVLEYSNLTDNGGGTFDTNTSVLSWMNVSIPAGQSVTHVFTVKVKDTIPTTALSQTNRSSFDLNMNNVYGNAVNIKLPAPVVKEVEEFAESLPNTGPAENTFFTLLFIGLVFYFYSRNRLVTKELGIIRSEFNGV